MTPKVSLRQALEDPALLGTALAGPCWHAWRSLLLATMGKSLTTVELEAFTRFTRRTSLPWQRVDELWCCVGRERNPDVEILNAARPALATMQGPLIVISSPYARRGAL